MNAENTCTDSMTQCTYHEHMWGGQYMKSNPRYLFQPIPHDELVKIQSQNYKVVAIDHDTVLTPKIFSNWLTFILVQIAFSTIFLYLSTYPERTNAFLIAACFRASRQTSPINIMAKYPEPSLIIFSEISYISLYAG